MLRKKEFIYDEYYDCYLCPEHHILAYGTTNKDGYREYKSRSYLCENCSRLSECTKSSNHTKVVTRHIWEEYLELCEDIRQKRGMKDIYQKRKETIERIFGTAKEYHGFRFTRLIGKASMEMKVGLTFTCMNIKKLVKILRSRGNGGDSTPTFVWLFLNFLTKKEKFLAFA